MKEEHLEATTWVLKAKGLEAILNKHNIKYTSQEILDSVQNLIIEIIDPADREEIYKRLLK